MKNYTPCPWSETLTGMTTMSWILFAGGIVIIAMILLFCQAKMTRLVNFTLYLLLGILALSVLFSYAFAPKGVSFDDKQIVLHRGIGKVVIPRSEITDIKPFPKGSPTIRLCGIGGFMGNVGLFSNDEIGKFTAYVTDYSKSYVIYRRSKRPIVITSVEPLN